MIERHAIEQAAREAFGTEPEPVAASRPFDWRPIIVVAVIQAAAVAVFVWMALT